MAAPANIVVQTAEGLRFKLNDQQVNAWLEAHPGGSVVAAKQEAAPKAAPAPAEAPAAEPAAEPATSTTETTSETTSSRRSSPRSSGG